MVSHSLRNLQRKAALVPNERRRSPQSLSRYRSSFVVPSTCTLDRQVAMGPSQIEIEINKKRGIDQYENNRTRMMSVCSAISTQTTEGHSINEDSAFSRSTYVLKHAPEFRQHQYTLYGKQQCTISLVYAD
mmetsp:Transcript_12560/g.19338  ORF Transcript_12560/g.19338 Transcript_12560/m.19338 type:complete len:131 (+) Transcript_12560:169-561(+)